MYTYEVVELGVQQSSTNSNFWDLKRCVMLDSDMQSRC